MKYRIKIETTRGGDKKFYTSYKKGFFGLWLDVKKTGFSDSIPKVYYSRKDALSSIDIHWEEDLRKRQEKVINTEIEYIIK